MFEWLQPILTRKQPDPRELKRLEDNMTTTLDKFQELFLLDGPFVNGQKISFADILAACEIEQLRECQLYLMLTIIALCAGFIYK